MPDVVWILLTVSPIVLIAGGFGWAASRARRRGLGGSLVGPFQDMWDPAAGRAQVAIEAQAEIGAPAPSPGDPPTPRTVRTPRSDG
ncbi:MAG: hypothetical protein QM809_10990 [Gordonia sp. (in: high G+C Gram-positive bacteria)]|uniref:hypothetical protein n=1 Tax=Gordonia sp. (in: high G+C Gram-positive bacteria) TaxID=84139 RepID=UPI0039E312EB